MKYVAKVKQVLRPDIHKIGNIEGKTVGILPRPDRVEIEMEGDENSPCMMFRYTNSNEFCGDTWHKNISRCTRSSLI